jgi:hypothetical protein
MKEKSVEECYDAYELLFFPFVLVRARCYGVRRMHRPGGPRRASLEEHSSLLALKDRRRDVPANPADTDSEQRMLSRSLPSRRARERKMSYCPTIHVDGSGPLQRKRCCKYYVKHDTDVTDFFFPHQHSDSSGGIRPHMNLKTCSSFNCNEFDRLLGRTTYFDTAQPWQRSLHLLLRLPLISEPCS